MDHQWPSDALDSLGGKLSHQRMKYNMDILHPRIEVEGEKKPFPVCASPVGRLTKFGDKPEDEVNFEETFGVGIVVYFRLLKFLVCLFLLFTVLSLPTLTMYAAGTDDSEGTFNSKNTFS
jgi:hypothetical protein